MKLIYIDGGATKTTGYFVIDNQIVNKITTGPSNLFTNYQLAINNITQILKQFAKADKIIIGIAGVLASKNNSEQLESLLSKTYDSEINVYGDTQLVVNLIKRFDNHFMLISLGTGTSVVTCDKNQINYYLGWGRKVNDLGSGYDIGIHLIRELCRYEDCQDYSNPAYQTFLKAFGCKSMRDYLPNVNDYQNVSGLAKWLFNQPIEMINQFVKPRIDALGQYLSFLKYDKIYCTGSIILKNPIVQSYLQANFLNQKLMFISFEQLIQQ